MIDTCPCCKYSLEGLPKRHACPECGYEYDRDSVALEQSKTEYKITAILLGFVVLFLVVTFFLQSRMNLWLLLLYAWLAGLHVWRVRRPSQIIIVSRSEVRLRKSAEKKDEVIPMEKIAYAKWNWAWGSVTVLSKTGETIRRIPVGFLGSNKLARNVADAINEYRQGDPEADT